MVQQIELLQNQKCQTGDSKSFREKNNKTFSSSKSYQALTYETKSFHVKSTRSSREDYSKNQKSQNGNKFFVTQKDFKRRTSNKIFFLVEKSPGVTCEEVQSEKIWNIPKNTSNTFRNQNWSKKSTKSIQSKKIICLDFVEN